MKYSFPLFLLFFALISTSLTAQNSAADDLWLTQMEEAKAHAKSENQPILMLFSGSDWCRPCMSMKARILDHKDFTDYAAANLTLLEVDFPRKSKNRLSPAQQQHNKAIADRYAPKYFPTLVLVDSSGKEIDRIGYQSSLSAADYVKFIQHRLSR